MLPEAMVTTLKSLKLFGMAQAIEELAAQNSPAYLKALSELAVEANYIESMVLPPEVNHAACGFYRVT